MALYSALQDGSSFVMMEVVSYKGNESHKATTTGPQKVAVNSKVSHEGPASPATIISF